MSDEKPQIAKTRGRPRKVVADEATDISIESVKKVTRKRVPKVVKVEDTEITNVEKTQPATPVKRVRKASAKAKLAVQPVEATIPEATAIAKSVASFSALDELTTAESSELVASAAQETAAVRRARKPSSKSKKAINLEPAVQSLTSPILETSVKDNPVEVQPGKAVVKRVKKTISTNKAPRTSKTAPKVAVDTVAQISSASDTEPLLNHRDATPESDRIVGKESLIPSSDAGFPESIPSSTVTATKAAFSLSDPENHSRTKETTTAPIASSKLVQTKEVDVKSPEATSIVSETKANSEPVASEPALLAASKVEKIIAEKVQESFLGEPATTISYPFAITLPKLHAEPLLRAVDFEQQPRIISTILEQVQKLEAAKSIPLSDPLLLNATTMSYRPTATLFSPGPTKPKSPSKPSQPASRVSSRPPTSAAPPSKPSTSTSAPNTKSSSALGSTTPVLPASAPKVAPTQSTSTPAAKPNVSNTTPKPSTTPFAGLNSAIVGNITKASGARPLPASTKNKPLPPNYNSVARRVTWTIVALPIAIVTSYVLWDRLVLGTEPKKLVRDDLFHESKDKSLDDARK